MNKQKKPFRSPVYRLWCQNQNCPSYGKYSDFTSKYQAKKHGADVCPDCGGKRAAKSYLEEAFR